MKTFNKAPLALAISALLVAPAAMADRWGGNDFDTDSSIDSNFDNDISVDIDHDQAFKARTGVIGGSVFYDPNYSGATVDSKQLSDGNESSQTMTKNNATVNGNALRGAAGNIGANVAAGDNNQQANDAALASSDASTVFGQASSFSAQSASNNMHYTSGSPNNATLGGNALRGASGNIGVNVAAGMGNAQHNSLAAAVNTASGSAQATTGGVQASYGNDTVTTGNKVRLWSGSSYEEDTRLTGGYAGVGLGGMHGEYEGTTEGVSDQRGDVYLDTWSGETHTGGNNTGHIDVDSVAQGAQDDNGDGGAFVFTENGTEEGSFSGGLGFVEFGAIALGGTTSGSSREFRDVLVYQQNNATLGGNALQGAVGNIGVNVASGSGNLQRNSLSIASSMGGSVGGGGGGGEQ
ncbi:hypothetical protein [Halomonas huangheensis]|uniref:Adhesin n=1 Tax=Halomonas huangheensis TaxID=1178482 RepID=W1N5A2_9GAMM|nr:hypothetical protein [Halomonas huangheensis]ALM51633.1 hypothetical protein AR456_04525 [Halomonas huangheensis]ERL50115.1 hypothetical protein BJB45_03040 [Halomonas huangheensis]